MTVSQEMLRCVIDSVNRQEGWSFPQLLRDKATSLSSRFPNEDGLLQIGVQGEESALVFIGGGNIQERASALQNVYNDDKKPGGSPHTASPHLWERRRLSPALEYEVSFVVLSGFSSNWRKGLACLAITRHRLAFGRSPFANFGARVRDESLPP